MTETIKAYDQDENELTPDAAVQPIIEAQARAEGRREALEAVIFDLQPISYPEACTFIDQHHRHHLPPQGWKFGIAVNNGTDVVGVITVGRPVARALDNGITLEVTRCCTDGTKNAASMLYGAAWRASKALGYKRLTGQKTLWERAA